MITYALIDNFGNLQIVLDINCKCSMERRLKASTDNGVVEVECLLCGKKVFLKSCKVEFE